MTSPDASRQFGAKIAVVNALMGMPGGPPPPAPPMYAMPPPMMEPPGASQVKTGLLVAGIGLILGSFLGLFLGFIGPLIVLIGAALIMTGAGKMNPAGRGMAMGGFVFVLIGLVLNIVSWVLTPAIILGGVYSADIYNSFATALLLSFVASLIYWIGVIILPMRLITGAGKALAIVGGILGLVGALLVFVMVYLALTGLISAGNFNLNEILAVIAGLIIGGILSLVGGILAGVGYIIGRGRLAMPSTMPGTM
ncbi:MAG TPA: hypothetical protein VJ400_02055 [Thermoplasmata archaeon]|nr:hypothetical protein [Thermoplasmata archaeon]